MATAASVITGSWVERLGAASSGATRGRSALTAAGVARCSGVARLLVGLAALTAGLLVQLGPAQAQIVPTPDPGRDCQTVRTCNFSRTGAVRGCLSSYTCRVCRTVRARCTIGEARFCERMVCSWGG